MNYDNLFEQMTAISKAHAYDILVEQVRELQGKVITLEAERDMLAIELKAERKLLKAYKDFVNEVRPTNATSMEMGKPDPNDLKDVNI